MSERDPELEWRLAYMTTYRPDMLADDIEFVEEAIQMDVDFEPFRQVGNVDRLLLAAANLAAAVKNMRQQGLDP